MNKFVFVGSDSAPVDLKQIRVLSNSITSIQSLALNTEYLCLGDVRQVFDTVIGRFDSLPEEWSEISEEIRLYMIDHVYEVKLLENPNDLDDVRRLRSLHEILNLHGAYHFMIMTLQSNNFTFRFE